jgi:hypothetical protein
MEENKISIRIQGDGDKGMMSLLEYVKHMEEVVKIPSE